MRPLPAPPLLAILEPGSGRAAPAALLMALLAGGCRWISLRAKTLAPEQQVALVRAFLPLLPEGAVLSLHGDPVLARAASLRAVHLSAGGDPRHARALLGEAALVGVSAHDAAEAAAAAGGGADYVTLSPIFPSTSKPGHAPREPLAGLAALAPRLSIPIVALGGITPERVEQCLGAGAKGIAVLGGLKVAADPVAAVRAYLAPLSEGSDAASLVLPPARSG